MSGNQLHGKHALGARANKSAQGILTVRFEMPYPIWCTSCPKPTIIGQGVRFNAEKKKVGNYFSTPIFSFRMKHTACGGWIEIRTDPKNTAYVVTEGARQRDLGENKVEEGDIKILTAEERENIRNNAFASLEGKVEDKQRLEYGKKRLEELQDISEQHWEDPYEKNQKLRKLFREGRKEREKAAGTTAALQDKMSLGLELLPEDEDDTRRAGFVEFGEVDSDTALRKAISKPLFAREVASPKKPSKKRRISKRMKEEEVAKKRTADMVADISGNTRAAMDPFLQDFRQASSSKSPLRTLLPGIKRKRLDAEEVSVPLTTSLVNYDSD